MATEKELDDAELQRQKEWWEERALTRHPELAIGKALSNAILEAQRKFTIEWETIPNLVLIHPADLRLIRHYAVEKEMFTYYVKQGEEECLPDNPTLRVMVDYHRKRGTFLVTTRKSLERSGVNGAV